VKSNTFFITTSTHAVDNSTLTKEETRKAPGGLEAESATNE